MLRLLLALSCVLPALVPDAQAQEARSRSILPGRPECDPRLRTDVLHGCDAGAAPADLPDDGRNALPPGFVFAPQIAPPGLQPYPQPAPQPAMPPRRFRSY